MKAANPNGYGGIEHADEEDEYNPFIAHTHAMSNETHGDHTYKAIFARAVESRSKIIAVGSFFIISLMIFFYYAGSFSAKALKKDSYTLDTVSSKWIYVLAYSWTPGYCYKKSYVGCKSPDDYWTNNYVLKGLWPHYAVTGSPTYCSNEQFDLKNTPKTVGTSTMAKYWPDVKTNEDDASYGDFWGREWSKHGTCSTLTQVEYFEAAISLAKTFSTPASFKKAIGDEMEAADLKKAMGGDKKVVLQCEGGKYLSGLYTCWSQLKGQPLLQEECPLEVLKEETCTASTLNIPVQ